MCSSRIPFKVLLVSLSLTLAACGDALSFGKRGPIEGNGDSADDRSGWTDVVLLDESDEGDESQDDPADAGGDMAGADGEGASTGMSSQDDASDGRPQDGGSEEDPGQTDEPPRTEEDDRSEDGVSGSAGDPSGEGSARFIAEQIALQSRARSSSTFNYQFMLTGTSGRLACRAIENSTVLPIGEGWQIWGVLDVKIYEFHADYPSVCPVGEHIVTPDPSCDRLYDYVTPADFEHLAGCVTRRRWNSDGTTYGIESARSGLVTVSETDAGCQFETEFIFGESEHLVGVHVVPAVDEPVVCGESR